jgi:hypothetical protein
MATSCRSRILSYRISRNASMFRRRGWARLLTASLAVVVQLHIFLVLELHHHVIGSRFLRDAASPGASLSKSQKAPSRVPACPACQVARQGAVQPGVEMLAFLPLRAIAAVVPASPLNIPVIFLLHPSGRDPPRS